MKNMLSTSNETIFNPPTRHTFCDENTAEFSVYLRKIPVSMCGTGQAAVGYILWSSAVILSRLLVNNKGILHDKKVLECGAGLGLCGIVSGSLGASAVTLTDFNDTLVKNLQYNIQINEGPALIDKECSAISRNCQMDVFILDWNNLALNTSGTSMDKHDDNEDNYNNDNNICIDDSNHIKNIENDNKYDNMNNNNEYHHENNDNKNIGDYKNSSKCNVFKDNEYGNKERTYDLIIGSDLVYCEKDTHGVFNVISRYLSENGIFIIVVPKPSHRYGTEFLKPFLHNHGLTVYSRIISHSTCTSSEVFQDGVLGVKGW
eukprot:CAMPEP_0119051870 /NCGR_PEP_ID=MMETSP1177-20130426/73346_1 /TAXON_ID=2985 /ORGANISM="Ochromonas sp, Strain CCMP1899" /LENGTH=316 /DNA_ID=CAMNT_0007031225 /DNA_START=480 /DNA_END=1427 /DNA_ORIENTATION=-